MTCSGWLRRLLVGALLAAGSLLPLPCRASDCRQGPLPENPDNQIVLCSPTPDEVQVQILPTGLELSWDAPPRATTAYLSPVTALLWAGVDSTEVVPGVTLSGEYQAFRDRRIQLDIETIDSLNVAVDVGVIGRDRVNIRWSSTYESTSSGALGGLFELRPGYSGGSLRFDVPNTNPLFPPDTTVVAGVRIRFTPGDTVRVLDAAVFYVEDFEGWHVWRWGADPTNSLSCDTLQVLPCAEIVGEYSKLTERASPLEAWPGILPDANRIVFFDSNVFDGFLYHYAITSFDQGFKRDKGGTDLAFKFDSPIAAATQNPDGSVTLGPTQIRVEYAKEPPDEFQAIAAVPNPYRESEADPRRPETQLVYFINVPPRGTLYVWTVAGDLVLQRDHSLPAVGTIHWDTKNQSGQMVSSGVYIYKIVDLVSGYQSYGRLAIIR